MHTFIKTAIFITILLIPGFLSGQGVNFAEASKIEDKKAQISGCILEAAWEYDWDDRGKGRCSLA